jgi:hypothetical protein
MPDYDKGDISNVINKGTFLLSVDSSTNWLLTYRRKLAQHPNATGYSKWGQYLANIGQVLLRGWCASSNRLQFPPITDS